MYRHRRQLLVTIAVDSNLILRVQAPLHATRAWASPLASSGELGPAKHEDVPVFVQQPMVKAAEHHEIVELGFAAIGPMRDVVGIHEAMRIAAGKPAAFVSCLQRPAQRGRDGSRLAADVQQLAIGIFRK